MDITPQLSADALRIRKYGTAGFTIAETLYEGSVLLTVEQVASLPSGSTLETLTPESLLPALQSAKAELLLIGGGQHMQPIPDALKSALRAAGIASEPMDTGAACRTYNVLLAEGRHVAAILLSVA